MARAFMPRRRRVALLGVGLGLAGGVVFALAGPQETSPTAGQIAAANPPPDGQDTHRASQDSTGGAGAYTPMGLIRLE